MQLFASEAKKFYVVLILCAILHTNLNSNVLLKSPKNLSDTELENLVKNWETQFTWNFGKGCYFTCCHQKGESSFLLQLLGIPVRSYNFQYIENIKKLIKTYNQNPRGYYFTNPLKIEKSDPKKINFNELIHLLKNKKFIFYTGAGISASGKVQTMFGLEKALKISTGKYEFFKAIFFNPTIITNAFSEFCRSAIYGLPTQAHRALHNIAQAKNICILTENVDLLQHRAGSFPISTHSDYLDQVTNKEFNEIDSIICVGLSRDDCGFLAYYKQKNPHGFIISIDLGIPDYLSDNDYLIQEDLQIVLSNLEKILCQ